MKTRRLFLAALCGVAMIVGTSSCKKEKNENENLGEEMRIAASLGIPDGGQKTHLDGTSVKWDSDDSFMLYSGSNGASFRIEPGEAGGTSATFVGTRPGAAPFYACYPSDATQTADGFTYTVLADQSGNMAAISTVDAGPMAAYYTGSGNLTFKNAMSWLYIGLTGDATIMKVELTDKSGAPLSGTLNVTVNSDNTLASTLTGNNSTLTIESATGMPLDDNNPTYFRFLVPAGAFKGTNNVEIKVYTESSIPKTFIKTFPELTGVAANKIYKAPIETKIKSPGFSVSPTLKVFFSSGNLQYNPSLDQWRFAPNQWDRTDNNSVDHYINYVNVYSETGTSWIDLFAWGTSGYNHGAVCYQPWSFNGNSNDYYKAYGDINYDLDQEGMSGQADWGHGRTFNGTADWRTLKDSEWDYMLNSRTNAALLKSTGNINGVNGAILLPDDWVLPSGVSFVAGAGSYNVNNYTLEQWAIMESAGAAFLPAAGSLDANSMPGWLATVNVFGWYWSATHDLQTAPLGSTGIYVYAAYGFVITGGNVFGVGKNDRSDGFSVRLVRNVPKP